jgi:A/G-specific adenine glycosylase
VIPSGSEHSPIPTPLWRRRLRSQLLRWFDKHRRDLPWRQDRDPYHIWVSEVMLQQTQVATVEGYFARFLVTFPTLRSLAAAAEQQVLRAWEGLGYYRRARDLHRAARQLVATHGGIVPDDPDVLRDLPGMGRYTLGAVLSQAFDRRMPIVEANSQRVLCRLLGQTGEPRRGPVRRWLWRVAEMLLPRRRVGDFNQALMELGALVCTPVAPRCTACPLSSLCFARRQGRQEEIPTRAASPETVEVDEVAVVIRRGRKVLLVQRPETGRWAGMWEFPHDSLRKKESHEAGASRVLAHLTGLRAELGLELLTIRHSVTRFHIALVCFEASYRSGTFRSRFYQQGKWLLPDQLPPYPVSRPQRRLAHTLVKPNLQRQLW